MERSSRFGPRAVGLVTLVVVASFALLFVGGSLGNGAVASPLVVDRALTISYDPVHASYTYGTVSLQVPVGSTVHFTITSYDPEPVGAVPSSSIATVRGTEGGTMTVARDGVSSVVSSVPVGLLAHTFTISNGYYQVNVPIPAAASPTDPVTVSFSVHFGVRGSFAWGCVLPCGSDDMTRMGTMFGGLLVA